MTRLILLRHGRTAWNDARRFQGHADIPLDEVGQAQAAAVAAALAGVGATGLWSSDLARAAETAELVGAAAGLSVRHDPRLREIHVGARQGLTLDEFGEAYPEQHALWLAGKAGYETLGGEAVTEVADRMRDCLSEVAATTGEGTALVVSHGAAIRIALAELLGCPMESLAGLGNCAWAELVHQGGWKLAAYNLAVSAD